MVYDMKYLVYNNIWYMLYYMYKDKKLLEAWFLESSLSRALELDCGDPDVCRWGPLGTAIPTEPLKLSWPLHEASSSGIH